MNDLFLIKSHVDIEYIQSWGRRHQHLVAHGDFGYVIHALLEMLFRKHRPNSFYFNNSCRSLYFYTYLNELQIEQQLSDRNKPALSGLGLAKLNHECEIINITSTIKANQNLSFQIQTSPTKRLTGSRAEVDVFSAKEGSEIERQFAYQDWLRSHLATSGVCEVNVESVAIKQHSVHRRESRSQHSGCRKKVVIDIPVATFTGKLKVDTSQCFLETLSRGVGRQKAFGFGMLRLNCS